LRQFMVGHRRTRPHPTCFRIGLSRSIPQRQTLVNKCIEMLYIFELSHCGERSCAADLRLREFGDVFLPPVTLRRKYLPHRDLGADVSFRARGIGRWVKISAPRRFRSAADVEPRRSAAPCLFRSKRAAKMAENSEILANSFVTGA
jgi:hypothetical protein